MRYLPFLFARLLHGFLSAAIVLLIWEPMQRFRSPQAVFSPHYEATAPIMSYVKLIFPISAMVFVGAFAVIMALFFAYSLLKLVYEKVGGAR
ncbi:hypothetical protein D3C84_914750 [compost metagenome]